VTGVQTCALPISTGKHVLYANIAVADLALGVYDYKIVKSYPDGRVETIIDKAEVTSVDANQIAVFGSSTKVDNTKFTTNWIISELSATFVKGTFTYEFTIGTVTQKYTINLVDRPQIEISGISVGSTNTSLLGTRYVLLAPAANAIGTTGLSIDLDFALSGIDENYFFKVNLDATNIRSGSSALGVKDFFETASVTSGATNDSGFQSFKDLIKINLGKFVDDNANANRPVTGNRVVYTITIYEKVDYSEIQGRYKLIGEPLEITIAYQGLTA
jgi:hypothetical protein